MQAIERVLAALSARDCDPRRNGKGYKAKCPAHEDRKPSLCINEGDDGHVLIHCQAGCPVDAVCQVLGLTKADLFDSSTVSTSTVSPRRPAKTEQSRRGPGEKAAPSFLTAADAVASLERKLGRRSALWTYHDAAGEPVGVVVRWDRADGTKDIRPVSRFPDGWRIEGMPEPRPLYGLPALADATTVYLVEGEKAADAARSLGLVATTSPHGANSAAKADWRPLAGKTVIRLPDNDPAGRQYVDDATAELAGLSLTPVVKESNCRACRRRATSSTTSPRTPASTPASCGSASRLWPRPRSCSNWRSRSRSPSPRFTGPFPRMPCRNRYGAS